MCNTWCYRVGWLLLSGWLVCGCRPAAPAAGTGEAGGGEGIRAFDVRGVVLGVDAPGRTVRIRHEAIPGYMVAMTMPFEVRDTNELAGIAVGDRVEFRMLVTEAEGWIDRLRKVGVDPSVLDGGREPVRRVRMVEPLELGEEIPDYGLTNQFGEALSLRGYRGKALGLTFIFTRCPYPNFCPRQNSQFAELARRLGSLAAGPTNWALLTVSFDPAYDTPQVLRAKAEELGADLKRWQFASGGQEDIDALTEQLGVMVAREGEQFSHNLRTAVIDARGRLRLNLVGDKWSVEEMLQAMVAAAATE